ncbi:MAG: phosphopantetheine-binding protein [Myxococcota bacterium]
MFEQRIRELISSQVNVPVDELFDSKHVVNDLGADSLDQTEILLACEHEFEIKLEMPEGGIGTVWQAIQLVRCALTEQAPAHADESGSRV